MAIQYIEPLSRGVSRMKRALFNPFNWEVWFTVGFTAFLAGLAKMHFSSGFNFGNHRNLDWEQVLYFPQRAWEWLTNNPGWAAFISVVIFVIVIVGIVLAWVSARGQFMFLDNVAWNRARVVAPWHEYRSEGNSLFIFNFVLGLLFLASTIVFFFYVLTYLQRLYEISHSFKPLVLPAILAGIVFVFVGIIGLLIQLFLDSFVVPIMYRDRTTTLKAIQKFFPTLISNIFYFIGYALFILCLLILVAIGILIAGCITCCCGFLILMIPYINAVVLLPVSYSFRAFSVEFLEQFGPEYRIFPDPDITPPPPQQAMA